MIEHLINMGGYAAYVWPSYGFAAVCIVGMYVITRRTLKAREAEFERLKRERREGP